MFESYEIRKGDTLDSISKKYNVSKEYLIDINNLYYYDDFKEGRELIVPKISHPLKRLVCHHRHKSF
jgi:LysM repeat protein